MDASLGGGKPLQTVNTHSVMPAVFELAPAVFGRGRHLFWKRTR